PRSVWWLTSPTVSVGIRVVCVADASDRKEREAYLPKIEVKIAGNKEKSIKIGSTNSPWQTVTGTVRNGGDRALDELEIQVHYLEADGRPHVRDISGSKPGRATFSKVWPVMANSSLEEDVRKPFGPGDTRAFTIDIPWTYDIEMQKEPKIV